MTVSSAPSLCVCLSVSLYSTEPCVGGHIWLVSEPHWSSICCGLLYLKYGLQLGIKSQQGKITLTALKKILAGEKRATKRLVGRVDDAFNQRIDTFNRYGIGTTESFVFVIPFVSSLGSRCNSRGEKIVSYRCHFYGTILMKDCEEDTADEVRVVSQFSDYSIPYCAISTDRTCQSSDLAFLLFGPHLAPA